MGMVGRSEEDAEKIVWRVHIAQPKNESPNAWPRFPL